MADDDDAQAHHRPVDAPGRFARAASAAHSRPPSPMPGTASRNENRAAPSRVRPSVRAIVMVTPERDVPGISASACAQPISSASRQPTEYSSRCAASETVRKPHQESETRQGGGDEQRIPQQPLDHVAEQPVRRAATGIDAENARTRRDAPSGVSGHGRRASRTTRAASRAAARESRTRLRSSVPDMYRRRRMRGPGPATRRNAAPGSRWPELEIGRNSERPCTMARMIA